MQMQGTHNTISDLPKHQKYKSSYTRFDYYWGIGVEHETYFKTSQTKAIASFEGNLKPERYSVNYYSAYNQEHLQKDLQTVIKNGPIQVPILMNSHSFTHCDVYGYHKTTYEKVPKLNLHYTGKSLIQWICERNQWFKTNLDKSIVWDGDTIELITQGFYKTNIKNVMKELEDLSQNINKELKKIPKQGVLAAYGPLSLASPVNEPWAIYLTNLRNVAMFNNGTIHINITLPTRLGWNKMPLFWNRFVEEHRRLARLIQWLEPLLIAVYGSGDPFSQFSDRYAKGSQRVAVSRYIGLGTFDTNTMARGKILQIPRGNIPWYDNLYSKTNYTRLDQIGLDINFNKHGAHGLEIRFFDQMPYTSLERVLQLFVLLMDVSLRLPTVENPTTNTMWHTMAEMGMYSGKEWRLSPFEITTLCNVLGIHTLVEKEPVFVTDVLEMIRTELFKVRGKCWKVMCSEIVPGAETPEKRKKWWCF